MKTCLTCEHLSEPESPHKWHRCMYVIRVPSILPASCTYTMDSVNIHKPHEDCPCWKERK